MHIAIVTQYCWPENVGPAIWLRQLAARLVGKGHRVTMVTTFPNYPDGRIPARYRGKLFMREAADGVEVLRTWIYATPSKKFWARVANFGSFCATSMIGAALTSKPDVYYVVMPPLPLGAAVEAIAAARGVPVVLNIQDIYPDIAVELGYLKNRSAIRFFRGLEQWAYRRSAGMIVISDRFRENLLSKGVPPEKIHVVPNWADSSEIQPGPRDNDFRRELGMEGRFVLVYSGGLTENSALPALLEGAALLKGEPYEFVIVGDGVLKTQLQSMAKEKRLTNVRFLPFQPLEKYAAVLGAADVQLVSLNAAASHFSLPSKLLKIMAAGRPVLAQCSSDSDLAQLLRQHECGVAVDPDDPATFAETVRQLARQPGRLETMGQNARNCLVAKFEAGRCIDQIENVLRAASGRKSGSTQAGMTEHVANSEMAD